MHNFFSADGGLTRFLTKVADLLILNITFLICCIPIFTIGAAITSLYQITLRMAANEEGYIFKGFLKAFKENFFKSTVIWVILLVIAGLIGTDYFILTEGTDTPNKIFLVLLVISLLLYIMVFLYVFPLQARFENTVPATLRNALIISLAHLPNTIFMLFIIIVPVFVTFINTTILSYAILLWLMFGFSLIAYTNSFIFNKIFEKYIES